MKSILSLALLVSFFAVSCTSETRIDKDKKENPDNKKDDTITKEVKKIEVDSAKEKIKETKIDSPIIDESEIKAEKPVIYTYSNTKTDISIALQAKGTLTFSYPLLNNNLWRGTVIPNEGIQVNGKIYPYLFWESLSNDIPTQIQESGFVIEGKNSIAFLEEKLNLMGLNQKEITDFITYWGPRMQENRYNFIHFLGTDEYATEIAELEISPKPDNLFRLYMYFRPMNSKKSVKEQLLPKINSRTGLTIVEWGGTELKAIDIAN